MKKILAVLLACCFVFAVMPAAAMAEGEETAETAETAEAAEVAEAVAEDTEDGGKVTPVIIVPGLGSTPLYLNPNTDEEDSWFKFDSSFMKTLWNTHVIRTTLSVCRGADVDVDMYIDKLATVAEAFQAFGCDENGDSVGNIGITWDWQDSMANHLDHLDSDIASEPAVAKSICDEIGAENVYMFNYDYRLDLVEFADDLSDFIDNVKEEKGVDKVTLVSASLGTCVVSAYIDRHQDKNDIKRTVFLDGAFNGVAITTLFRGDVYLDSDVIFNFLEETAETYRGAVNIPFKTINRIAKLFDGTLNNIIDFLNEIANNEEYLERLYKEVILPIAGNMPGLWACVPYDEFDACVEYMEDIGWLDTQSGFYEKIVRYHEIQGRLEENLAAIQENGTEVAIMAAYGYPGLPLVSGYVNTSDLLIDTKYAGTGALVADQGTTLSEEETAEYDEKYTSADGMICAGSCLCPDSTWFTKYMQHMQFVYDCTVDDLMVAIVTSEDEVTVDSIEEKTGYGQFTYIDEEFNIHNLDELEEEPTETDEE